ncbi:MAG TPA: GNAT family N-acetyltransferase [Terriglobales bacterium]|nr:GNAT family N-acetyltransferase [Terriglobales bacterium]
MIDRMEPCYTTRLATPDDASTLAEMRRRMFISMGKPDDERMQRVVKAFAEWVADAIGRGIYIGWLVETAERGPIANAGLLLIEWPPNLRDLGLVRGYILNVWTNPEHRRKGIARRLIETVMAEAREKKIHVLALHASDEGKQIYEKLGFRTSREMMYVEPE